MSLDRSKMATNLQPQDHTSKLAVEILWRVFRYCCETAVFPGVIETSESLLVLGLNSAPGNNPLTLAHVSRHWRLAALDLPPMWSFIRIFDGKSPDAISFWLQQSRHHPLDIVIYHVHADQAQITYDLLSQHMHRWRELHISAYPWFFSSSTWSSLLSDRQPLEHQSDAAIVAPQLEALEIQMIRVPHGGDRSSSKRYLHISSPVLTRFIIVRGRLNWRWSLPWECRLTWLDITDDHQERCFGGLLECISQMAALKHLRLAMTNSCSHRLPPVIDHTRVLSELQTCRIRIVGSCPTFWAWMAGLNAPKLWSLHINHHSYCNHGSARSQHLTWNTLPTSTPLPSLEDFSWGHQEFHFCAKCLEPFIPKILTVINLSIDILALHVFSAWGSAYTRLGQVVVRGQYENEDGRDESGEDGNREDEQLGAREIIRQMNPKASVTFKSRNSYTPDGFPFGEMVRWNRFFCVAIGRQKVD
ncbi:hypothetical protein FRC02_012302 [Tulasnella sp. 418]|nr:hypothetical protein FRC02_012302 [Tulasnella sp. 418]